VCEVLFAWDEKRGGDVVYAAGWNAKVCRQGIVMQAESMRLLNSVNLPACCQIRPPYTARAAALALHPYCQD
jgi:hypothetical protein